MVNITQSENVYHPVMRILYKLLFLLLFCTELSAQHFDVSQYRGELNIKLEVIDEKRLLKGIEILNEASIIENEALGILKNMPDSELIEASSSGYNKMIKKLLEASDTYHEGHLYIYNVFNESCEKFREEMRKMNHYDAGMQKAKTAMTMVNMMAIGISRDPKRTKIRAVAKP